MAFSLYVTRGSDTTQLNDGSPFRMESAEGLSNADVVRFGQGGPTQQGVTDLGYRVQPRTITLKLLFHATTDALLDEYRDRLAAAFRLADKNLVNTFFWGEGTVPENVLSVVRDDGATRSITVQSVDELTIELVPEERAAKLHRATVVLRAANPFWQGDVSTINVPVTASWFLAGGRISSTQVVEFDELPGARETWDWTSGNAPDDWTVAFVTTALPSGSAAYAWDSSVNGAHLRYSAGSAGYVFNNSPGTPWAGGTALNYHIVERKSTTSYWRYWDGTALALHGSVGPLGDNRLFILGTWRGKADVGGQDWTPAITRGVIIRGTSSLDQLNALAPYMLGSVTYGISPQVVGDLPVYPTISITGPITSPVLVNTATGGSINLTGLTLGTAQTARLSLSGGDKSLTNATGINIMGSVTSVPLGMADFYLKPPDADFDGLNTISISGSGIGAAAQVSISWTEQYVSF